VELPVNVIKDVLRSGRMSSQAKTRLLAVLAKRNGRSREGELLNW